MNVDIIKGNIGQEYIHMLVSCPPELSVSKLMQQLKEKTSRVLLSEYKNLKKDTGDNIYRLVDNFCRIVGFITQEVIKDYIENQEDELEDNYIILAV